MFDSTSEPRVAVSGVGWEYRYPQGYYGGIPAPREPLTNESAAATLPLMAKAEVIEWTEDFDGTGSSSIGHVWYNSNTGRMTVRFVAGGLYSYDGVSEELYTEFAMADSLGQFFREHFRSPGKPWPGAKHVERTTSFRYVEPEPASGPDLDALKPELVTLGKGKTFKLRFSYKGTGEMNVRGQDWQEAVDTFVQYMETQGFEVTVNEVVVPVS